VSLRREDYAIALGLCLGVEVARPFIPYFFTLSFRLEFWTYPSFSFRGDKAITTVLRHSFPNFRDKKCPTQKRRQGIPAEGMRAGRTYESQSLHFFLFCLRL